MSNEAEIYLDILRAVMDEADDAQFRVHDFEAPFDDVKRHGLTPSDLAERLGREILHHSDGSFTIVCSDYEAAPITEALENICGIGGERVKFERDRLRVV